MGCSSGGQYSPSVESDWDNCGGCAPGFGGFDGLEFPSAMGPLHGQDFALDNGNRFVGGLGATNFVQYFDATQDMSFLKDKLLPLVGGVADFYVSYAVPSNSAIFGPFGVRHGAPATEISLPFSCSQEVCHGAGNGAEANSHQDLSYMRMVLSKLLQYSNLDPKIGVTTVPAAKRSAWATALAALADFPTVLATPQPNRSMKNWVPNTTILAEFEMTIANSTNITRLPTANATRSGWHDNFGYPITHLAAMYPAAVIGRATPEPLLQIAKDTLFAVGAGGDCDLSDPSQVDCDRPGCTLTQNNNCTKNDAGWTPPNGYCLLWPGAGRLSDRNDSVGGPGLSSRYLLIHWGRSLNYSMTSSGWPSIMGGLEEIGAIPGLLGMLLDEGTVDGVIRLFPGWTSGSDASFTTLRGAGAFLVSATYNASTPTCETGCVTSGEIISEMGRRLTIDLRNFEVQAAKLCVFDGAGGGKALPTTTTKEGYTRLDTVAGHRYALRLCGSADKGLAPTVHFDKPHSRFPLKTTDGQSSPMAAVVAPRPTDEPLYRRRPVERQ